MLLLWLRMLWLGVDLTTVIPCLGFSRLLIFVSCNVFKIVWQELLSLSTSTSLLLGRLSIGCLLSTILYPRHPYWYTFTITIRTRPMHRRTDANLYPPERQLTKASEPSFDLEGETKGQI